MLGNTGNVAKLYMSIIEDVIESMRELIVEEGLEDRVLDDLKRMWEAKVIASKALEDCRHSNVTSSKFVLQLPAHYNHSDQDRRPRVAVGIPTSQNAFHFPLKKGTETIATFSLPPGLSYPVQIPAGVTLQTASGHLYKVNVPVVVTQGPAGNNPFSQTTQKIISWRESTAPQPAGGTSSVKTVQTKVGTAQPASSLPQPASSLPQPASSLPQPASSLPQPASSLPQPASSLPQPASQPQPAGSQPPAESQPPQSQSQNLIYNPSQENMASRQVPPVPLAVNLHSQVFQQQPAVTVEERFQPGPEPGNTGVDTPISEFFSESLETLAQAPAGTVSKDIDDILKQVIEDEMNKAVTETVFSSYSELSDIVQLDGPLDNSDIEAEDEVALEDNDFLGMINAEAMDGSSDGDSASSSSDGDAVDELTDIVEEDPLNSGDDVHEQDIPDLFDTDNVIVCQYDKIHRSKNRWKFHLKDAVMSYGGRDYVFSKAVGEAEW